jgi:hypothetical protein
MIVKVPERRRDGKSSFEDLGGYITEGIGQAGIDTEVGSFARLTQYITKESVIDALGEDVEKTIGVEMGNIDGCLSTAPAEMRAVAEKNPRAGNAVLHYILSWPENEKPTPEKIFEAARSSLKALGLQDHQYIIAIHDNTENRHAHIAANRVHPVTFKAQRIEWLHKTLHKAVREIEIEHGWSHDNGLFNVVMVNGVKHVVASNDEVSPTRTKGKAGLYEVWTGEQSLETWCKGAPGEALKKVLENTSTYSWQQVHRELAQFGLELRDSGGGGMRVYALDQNASQHPLSVSASKAFRFLKRPALEQRLGKFEPSTGNFDVEVAKSYKRDSVKRLERRLERKALRDALQKRFADKQKAARVYYEFAKKEIALHFDGYDATRLKALDAGYKAQRAAIKADTSIDKAAKQQAYMLAKVAHLEVRHELRALIIREKQERRALLPELPSWRSWVEEQAILGDEAAVSALRGMVYQEKRDGNQSAKQPIEDDPLVNAIRPAQPSITDPFIRKIPNLMWKVGRNGTVAYNFKSGETGFIDAGEKLVFGRAQVTDEALALTLQYAKDKWRGDLHMSGGDAVFKARAARMANKLGIALANPDLKALQARYKAEAPRPAPSLPVEQPIAPAPIAKAASLEGILRAREPDAEVQHATTQSNRYSGKIVAEDEHSFAQSVGKGKIVIHEKRLFPDKQISAGSPLTIAYRSGKPTVVARKARVQSKDR